MESSCPGVAVNEDRVTQSVSTNLWQEQDPSAREGFGGFLLLSRPLLTNRRALVEVDEVAGRAGLGRAEKHAQDDGNLTSRFRRESNSRVMDALGYADGGRSYA